MKPRERKEYFQKIVRLVGKKIEQNKSSLNYKHISGKGNETIPENGANV